MIEDSISAAGPPHRLTPWRILGMCLYGALLTFDGWLLCWTYTANDTAGGCGDTGQRPCTTHDLWAVLAFVACLALGFLTLVLLPAGAVIVTSSSTNSTRAQLPAGAAMLGGLVCLLGGIALRVPGTGRWLLGPMVLIIAVAVLVGRREERTRARTLVAEHEAAHRGWRMEQYGLTALGTVTDAAATGDESYDRPEFVITVRFRTPGGDEHTAQLTSSFDSYEQAPRPGDRLHLRYDPEHPRQPELATPRTAPEDSGD
ncbi:DUF3592 domain-containing protein [Streptacidiphilus sp. P02-A3a]|uniref:DUF3592 domain-containing protein n=1 Tax=Streptacidiphilus sp. P02-A3a TaxID=2704468 RepID=UPI0015FAA923|nr:DUF3592 domain-containing protein [Streptacidiphilus sp. P02-A3a]QMU70223.1 DUF3592 domain-containing protein [Streptacidiphilus sp. P02-A3a]QMU70321.1 DUF3592 domain-containing protein [Streptacidiphilus sp. P02-A3a]